MAGGGGDDTLDGGLGNDTASYAAATSGVIVNLSLATPQNVGGGQGTDTLISIERLLGSAYADTLTGDGAINVLTGGNGNDILDGGAGIDTLDGGYGDDTYYTDGADTLVDISKNGGIDTIVLDASYAGASYTLGAVFENLTLTGSANTNVIGNASDNILRGNAGANVLEGGAGNDTYYVGALDTIVELAGKKGGIDTVFADATFTLADPLLENLTLTGTGDFNATGNALANIIIGNAGDNTLDGGAGADTLNGGAGNDTYIVGAGDTVSEAALGGNDSVQSDASFVLGANLENLTLTGLAAINGTGNAENNVINGNGGDNVLAGGGGDDTLDGGLGNDTASYAAATSGVIVNLSLATPQNVGGGQGTDTLISIERLLGSAYADTLTGDGAINVLTGGNGNDILDGGAGIDTLDGGYGDDTYYTDGADTLVDISKNGGIDTIVLDASYAGASYTLGAVFENLTLTGSANTNVIGNASDNILRGNAGANVLEGGAGNDTYYVGALDTIVELAGKKGGIDTVFADATFTLADPLLENLTLTGTGDFNATGNALANIIIGNDGANVLTGGAGDDIYYAGAGDSVVEDSAAGTDIVYAAVNWSLDSNIENLTLTGIADINGAGNTLNNVINGNSGANVLSGGDGNDTLSSGGAPTRSMAAPAPIV